MSVVDWGKLESELERMVERWENATGRSLTIEQIDTFGYGFELGFRIASGEEIQ